MYGKVGPAGALAMTGASFISPLLAIFALVAVALVCFRLAHKHRASSE